MSGGSTPLPGRPAARRAQVLLCAWMLAVVGTLWVLEGSWHSLVPSPLREGLREARTGMQRFFTSPPSSEGVSASSEPDT